MLIFVREERNDTTTKANIQRDIIVMTSAPVPGLVKTRMTPELTPEQCARLQAAFLADVGATCRAAAQSLGCVLVLLATPEEHLACACDAFGPCDVCDSQASGGLGQRMAAAFAGAFGRGAGQCVLLGSDSPELAVRDITYAFELLKTHDCVISPTLDGGYFLIGMSANHAGLFNIEGFGGPHVFERSCLRASELGLGCAVGTCCADMDTPEDLHSLARRIEDGVAECPATAMELARLAWGRHES